MVGVILISLSLKKYDEGCKSVGLIEQGLFGVGLFVGWSGCGGLCIVVLLLGKSSFG